MKAKEQKGIFSKIFGGSKKESCYAIELEEFLVQDDLKNEAPEKESVSKDQKPTGCRCSG